MFLAYSFQIVAAVPEQVNHIDRPLCRRSLERRGISKPGLAAHTLASTELHSPKSNDQEVHVEAHKKAHTARLAFHSAKISQLVCPGFFFLQQNLDFVRQVPKVAWEGVAQGHGGRVWRQSGDRLAYCNASRFSSPPRFSIL